MPPPAFGAAHGDAGNHCALGGDIHIVACVTAQTVVAAILALFVFHERNIKVLHPVAMEKARQHQRKRRAVLIELRDIVKVGLEFLVAGKGIVSDAQRLAFKAQAVYLQRLAAQLAQELDALPQR